VLLGLLIALSVVPSATHQASPCAYSVPSGFLVVFEKPNRSSFTFTFTPRSVLGHNHGRAHVLNHAHQGGAGDAGPAGGAAPGRAGAAATYGEWVAGWCTLCMLAWGVGGGMVYPLHARMGSGWRDGVPSACSHVRPGHARTIDAPPLPSPYTRTCSGSRRRPL
jgi:hypothetical protein